jgi:hypothetical protein
MGFENRIVEEVTPPFKFDPPFYYKGSSKVENSEPAQEVKKKHARLSWILYFFFIMPD